MDEKFVESISKISEGLQEIEKKIKEDSDLAPDDGLIPRIKFPRGYIRSCEHYREKYRNTVPFGHLSNVAYTLQLSDVYRYILNRLDLGLTAQEMFIKYGIVAIFSVIESSVNKICYDNNIDATKCSKNLRKLLSSNKISKELFNEVDEVRIIRDNIHLHITSGKEYGKYNIEMYNKSIATLNKLKEFHDRKFEERNKSKI